MAGTMTASCVAMSGSAGISTSNLTRLTPKMKSYQRAAVLEELEKAGKVRSELMERKTRPATMWYMA